MGSQQYPKCSISECEAFSSQRYFRGWCRNHYQRWQKHGDPRAGKGFAPGVRLDFRIASLTDRSGGPNACWPWLGNKRERGYGRLIWGGRLVPITHLVYELDRGHPPEKPFILHTCDNPPCVNPRHLWSGTQQDNMSDMERKGRRTPACGEQHGMSKLTEKAVLQIRQALALGERPTTVAKSHEVSKDTIYLISKRKVWAWL